VTPVLDGDFPVDLVGGVPVVTTPPEMDMVNAPKLEAALLEAASGGHGVLVADMTRTRFCDSAALHALVAAHKRAQAEGGELLLVIGSAAVRRIFEITGADQVIANFSSLDEALASIAQGIRRPSA
jgi:anti-sigma B factor antagonist